MNVYGSERTKGETGNSDFLLIKTYSCTTESNVMFKVNFKKLFKNKTIKIFSLKGDCIVKK